MIEYACEDYGCIRSYYLQGLCMVIFGNLNGRTDLRSPVDCSALLFDTRGCCKSGDDFSFN